MLCVPLSAMDKNLTETHKDFAHTDIALIQDDCWQNPWARFAFYAPLLMRIAEGDERRGKRQFPLNFLKRQVARSSGRLLQYAKDLEGIQETFQTAQHYTVSVLGGTAIAIGLLLAPVTGGGSVALAVSMAAGFGMEGADLGARWGVARWEESYMEKAMRDEQEVMDVVHCLLFLYFCILLKNSSVSDSKAEELRTGGSRGLRGGG